ncbi:MAG: hypothetical protein PHP46_04545, partial [Candidatus Omnitrophica bacterium]|nr:hypothetical protein [Candidatus Omnitrophota bacterium]
WRDYTIPVGSGTITKKGVLLDNEAAGKYLKDVGDLLGPIFKAKPDVEKFELTLVEGSGSALDINWEKKTIIIDTLFLDAIKNANKNAVNWIVDHYIRRSTVNDELTNTLLSLRDYLFMDEASRDALIDLLNPDNKRGIGQNIVSVFGPASAYYSKHADEFINKEVAAEHAAFSVIDNIIDYYKLDLEGEARLAAKLRAEEAYKDIMKLEPREVFVEVPAAPEAPVLGMPQLATVAADRASPIETFEAVGGINTVMTAKIKFSPSGNIDIEELKGRVEGKRLDEAKVAKEQAKYLNYLKKIILLMAPILEMRPDLKERGFELKLIEGTGNALTTHLDSTTVEVDVLVLDALEAAMRSGKFSSPANEEAVRWIIDHEIRHLLLSRKVTARAPPKRLDGDVEELANTLIDIRDFLRMSTEGQSALLNLLDKDNVNGIGSSDFGEILKEANNKFAADDKADTRKIAQSLLPEVIRYWAKANGRAELLVEDEVILDKEVMSVYDKINRIENIQFLGSIGANLKAKYVQKLFTTHVDLEKRAEFLRANGLPVTAKNLTLSGKKIMALGAELEAKKAKEAEARLRKRQDGLLSDVGMQYAGIIKDNPSATIEERVDILFALITKNIASYVSRDNDIPLEFPELVKFIEKKAAKKEGEKLSPEMVRYVHNLVLDRINYYFTEKGKAEIWDRADSYIYKDGASILKETISTTVLSETEDKGASLWQAVSKERIGDLNGAVRDTAIDTLELEWLTFIHSELKVGVEKKALAFSRKSAIQKRLAGDRARLDGLLAQLVEDIQNVYPELKAEEKEAVEEAVREEVSAAAVERIQKRAAEASVRNAAAMVAAALSTFLFAQMSLGEGGETQKPAKADKAETAKERIIKETTATGTFNFAEYDVAKAQRAKELEDKEAAAAARLKAAEEAAAKPATPAHAVTILQDVEAKKKAQEERAKQLAEAQKRLRENLTVIHTTNNHHYRVHVVDRGPMVLVPEIRLPLDEYLSGEIIHEKKDIDSATYFYKTGFLGMKKVSVNAKDPKEMAEATHAEFNGKTYKIERGVLMVWTRSDGKIVRIIKNYSDLHKYNAREYIFYTPKVKDGKEVMEEVMLDQIIGFNAEPLILEAPKVPAGAELVNYNASRAGSGYKILMEKDKGAFKVSVRVGKKDLFTELKHILFRVRADVIDNAKAEDVDYAFAYPTGDNVVYYKQGPKELYRVDQRDQAGLRDAVAVSIDGVLYRLVNARLIVVNETAKTVDIAMTMPAALEKISAFGDNVMDPRTGKT